VSNPTAKRIAVPDNKLLTRHCNGLGFIATIVNQQISPPFILHLKNFAAIYRTQQQLCRFPQIKIHLHLSTSKLFHYGLSYNKTNFTAAYRAPKQLYCCYHTPKQLCCCYNVDIKMSTLWYMSFLQYSSLKLMMAHPEKGRNM
jgi:hypothetical protein